MPDQRRSAAEAAADAWMHEHRGQAKTDSDREAFIDGFESASRTATQQRLVEALRLVLPYAASRVEDLGCFYETAHDVLLGATARNRYEGALLTLRDVAPESFNDQGYLITVPIPEYPG